MFTYHQIKAMRQHRFERYRKENEEARARRKGAGHRSLTNLFAALAGRLANLGVRGRDGRSRPARPAH